MTAEEFDAAAFKLLTSEHQGSICLPMGPERRGWTGDDESADESVPLRMETVRGRFGPQNEPVVILQGQSKKKKSTGPNGR